jgi:uncharacterized oxidoreductase
MRASKNTILITGGASGIGLALAERFLKAGNELLLCGRREEKLLEIRRKHPAVKTRVCDVSLETDRVALYDWAVSEAPGLNVLVNNAGIQRRVELAKEKHWEAVEEEIAVNFHAPVHLTMLFLPLLLKQKEPAILNVTSGLAFVPKADVPVYCATKAALHSFTLSLRRQLTGSPVEVIEVIPPAVNTDLGGPGLHTFGVPVDQFADHVMERLKAGALEIPFGFSEQSSRASRAELDEIFERMNQPSRV